MTVEYNIENPSEIKEELLPLHEKHYEDDFRKSTTALDIDWGIYNLLYEDGSLICMIAREEEKIVGYMTTHVATHPHNKNTVLASMDTLFVDIEHRSKGIATGLMTSTEKEAYIRGAVYMNAGFRDEALAELVAGKLGYKKIECTLGKVLKGE